MPPSPASTRSNADLSSTRRPNPVSIRRAQPPTSFTARMTPVVTTTASAMPATVEYRRTARAQLVAGQAPRGEQQRAEAPDPDRRGREVNRLHAALHPFRRRRRGMARGHVAHHRGQRAPRHHHERGTARAPSDIRATTTAMLPITASGISRQRNECPSELSTTVAPRHAGRTSRCAWVIPTAPTSGDEPTRPPTAPARATPAPGTTSSAIHAAPSRRDEGDVERGAAGDREHGRRAASSAA